MTGDERSVKRVVRYANLDTFSLWLGPGRVASYAQSATLKAHIAIIVLP